MSFLSHLLFIPKAYVVCPPITSPTILSYSPPCSLSFASGPLHLLFLLLGNFSLPDLYSNVTLVRPTLITLFKIATYPTHIPYPPPPPLRLYFLHCSDHPLTQWHTNSVVGMGNLPWVQAIRRCIIHRKFKNIHEMY